MNGQVIDYCPICGIGIHSRSGHQCDPKRLASIDGAHNRDLDDEEPKRKPYDQRLKEGFGLLSEEESDEDQGQRVSNQ